MPASHMSLKKSTCFEETAALVIFFLSFPKSLKSCCLTKWYLSSINFCRSSSVVFIREAMLSIAFYHSVDTKNVFGALLTDLLKAFNCLPHKVIVARFNTYGFSLPALKICQKLLSQWKTKSQGKLFIQLLEWYTL